MCSHKTNPIRQSPFTLSRMGTSRPFSLPVPSLGRDGHKLCCAFTALTVALATPSTSIADSADSYHALVAPCKSVLHNSDFELNVPIAGGRHRAPGTCETQQVLSGPRKRNRTQIEVRFNCRTVAAKPTQESTEFYARKILYFTLNKSEWRIESAELSLTGIPPTPSAIHTKTIPTASLGSLLPLAATCLGSP